MKAGDLVKHAMHGLGVVIKISKPTVMFPYQIASVCFPDGHAEELATTTLTTINSEKKVDT